MPLTKFQSTVAKLLAPNRTPDSYLAGGAAIHLLQDSKRYSNDLDYFNDSEERVASAFAEDQRVLLAAGHGIEVVLRQSGFIRGVVSGEGEATKVEWAHDSAWRFLSTLKTPDAGFVLNPIDLAINKLLALVGRDEPRDYFDIHDLMSRVLPLGALCWAAAGKDPGFTPAMILSLLRRRGKYRPEDFSRLDLVEPVDVVEYKIRWLAALEATQTFIEERDPKEVGCLYYSPLRKCFVQPATYDDVAPMHGCIGGSLIY